MITPPPPLYCHQAYPSLAMIHGEDFAPQSLRMWLVTQFKMNSSPVKFIDAVLMRIRQTLPFHYHQQQRRTDEGFLGNQKKPLTIIQPFRKYPQSVSHKLVRRYIV